MDGTLLLEIVVAIVVIWIVLLVLLYLARPRGTDAREVIRLIPDVLGLLRRVLTAADTPLGARLVIVGLIAWILSPIDLIPEFIPVLGPLDDVIVAILAMRYLRRRLGREGLHARWPGSEEGFATFMRVLGDR